MNVSPVDGLTKRLITLTNTKTPKEVDVTHYSKSHNVKDVLTISDAAREANKNMNNLIKDSISTSYKP